MIRLENVSKAYGDEIAVQPLNTEIPSGETTVLIGPSGCGKSTLLRLFIGLIMPTSGRIVFDGKPVDEKSSKALRRQVGYVIQNGGLFPHLTARRNVTLMARHLGWSRKDRSERIDELSSLVQLPTEWLGRYPNELSGGQRQRVALMRALMLRPQVLLLDEPLGALDPLVRTSLQDELVQIFERLDITVVMVTHDMAEAAHFADRIILMENGRIVQEGTVEDLTERPAEPFVSDFLSAQRTQAF